ncbi:ABC transporter permease [Bowdeniella nasicola]|uniref:ABC transporter permease n=1 Tax=Bowdeniella nasicola TaxID=208480 RepID=A0A1Q5Q1T8_9ACTO|nr:MptD family putative ECF transporter S component [Bowdeniella nasicola]OKL53652.1 ABC transporter permease [Bowdeniella nasicola]
MFTTARVDRSGLTTRDFISIGVFTALIFVIIFGTGMLGFIPILMFVGFFLGIIGVGIVFALFTARTPKFGAVTIMSLLISLFFMGTGHWAGGIIFALVGGLCADLVITRGPSRAMVRVPIAYALFIVPLYISPWVPLFLDRDAYVAGIEQEMGAEYAAKLFDIVTPTTLLILFAVMFVIALGSGALGVAIGRKHFERAGLV